MDRIYIDVTATANTLHHTGIQRIVRSLVIFGAIRTEAWIPVIWSASGFRAPKRNERMRLTEIFSKGPHRRRGISRLFDRWEKEWKVDFLTETEDAMLLLPEIPAGERLEFLDDLAATGARRISMVAICHDLLSWSRPQWTPSSRREGFIDYLRFLGLVERVVCPSRATAEEWRRFQKEHGFVGAEPEVLPWPVSGKSASRSESETDPPLVLSVGTLEKRKNHAGLLDAAEILWAEGLAFELILVGRLRAKDETEIPDRISEMRRAGRTVSWLGPVDDATLEDLYHRAAFTVFPSFAEGYGLPVAESLSRGCPCVCSSEGAVGEIAREGGCQLVDVTNVGSLADGMRKLILDRELRKGLSARAADRTWPTWEEWMDQLLDSGSEDDETV